MMSLRYHPMSIGLLLLSLFLLCLLPCTAAGAAVPEQHKIVQQFLSRQIPFIENQGEADPRVRYYAQALEGTLFVTADGAMVYAWKQAAGDRDASTGDTEGRPGLSRSDAPGKGLVITERLVGSRPPVAAGKEPSEHQVSFFKGNDPSRWRQNVNTYDLVSLGAVYPGIELQLKAFNRNVEKIFRVQPGGRPEQIRLKVDQAWGLKVNAQGELEVQTQGGTIKYSAPVAYQEIDGRRLRVPVKYRVQPATPRQGRPVPAYAFQVGAYDKGRELVIDPNLVSTFYGGSARDFLRCSAIAPNGDVYVAGATYSTDLPGLTGGYDTTLQGSDPDAFVARINPNGLTPIRTTYLGGSNLDAAYSIVVDQQGKVFIAGDTRSSDFPTTLGAFDRVYNGGRDVFIARLNADLSTLECSTFFGGTNYEASFALALSGDNQIYVAGQTNSHNFPTAGSTVGGLGAFIAKLNSDLSELTKYVYLNMPNCVSVIPAMKVNSAGDLVMAGSLYSYYFGRWFSSVSVVNSGWTSMNFVFFDTGYNIYGQLIATNANDITYALELDSQDNIYVAGETWSTDFPTSADAYCRTNKGMYDAFVYKMDSSLTGLAATLLGGSDYDTAYALARDKDNNIYVAGDTWSSDFPTTADAYSKTKKGGCDTFLCKLDGNLTTLKYSTYAGGGADDFLYALAINTNTDKVYLAGTTFSPDHHVTGAGDSYKGGGSDGFLSLFGEFLNKKPPAPIILLLLQ